MTPRSNSLRDASQRVRVRVPAKINLALKVGVRRLDGYHPLATVFQAVSLFDELTAVRCDATISVHCAGEQASQVSNGPENLAYRAAELLRERYGHPQLGVELSIDKNIPVAGGMAGGSADAGAALLATSILWDLDTSPDELHELAAELGSDVPFALVGGTAIGRGRGDELVPMLTRGAYHWVLALSEQGQPTPAVFDRFDELSYPPATPQLDMGLLNALANADVQAVARLLSNDLQAAALSLRPELGEVMDAGLAAGALAGIVSGSGPTIAFLCATERAGLGVAAELGQVPGVRAVRRARGPVAGAQLMA